MATAADHELAHRLADESAALLLALRAEATGSPKERGKAGDQQSGAHLLSRLHDERPSDAVLMEDSADDQARVAASRVWIIDPLDGTREFGEEGRIDWAVHVALAEEGLVTAAAVALPARGLVLSTARAQHIGSGDDGGHDGVRIAVSRSRPAPFADALAAVMGAQLVPLGSAGFKTAAVLLGEVDAYVHAGGQYEWDTAAPAGVALAAGAHASRIDGSPLVYNQPNPWLPDLLVCRAELSGAMLEHIAGVAASG